MIRYIAAAVTVAAALLFAAPAGAVDPLKLTKSSPADRATVPLTPTGGIAWQLTTAGVPDDAQVAVTVSSTGATGGDGVTLATADRVDFFFLSSTGAAGGWAARSDPGPNAWSADAGTYFWQAVATWTDAGGVFHSAASPIARLFLGVSPPAGSTNNPGAAPGSARKSLRMSALDASFYVRTMIRRHTHRAAAGLRTSCARVSTPTYRCRPSWRDTRNTYRTTASFTHVRSGGRVVARATVTGRRASRSCVRRRSFSSCARQFRWRSTIAARPTGTR